MHEVGHHHVSQDVQCSGGPSSVERYHYPYSWISSRQWGCSVQWRAIIVQWRAFSTLEDYFQSKAINIHEVGYDLFSGNV